MTLRQKKIAERERLARLVSLYEGSSQLRHFEEARDGTLTKDVTPERIADVKRRLAALDNLLGREGQ